MGRRILEIASRAGVPEGSACHFYANRFDLFSALAAELTEEFIRAHRRPAPESRLTGRQALAEHLVDVGARIYRSGAPARQLLIGAKTPAEVKQADRIWCLIAARSTPSDPYAAGPDQAMIWRTSVSQPAWSM